VQEKEAYTRKELQKVTGAPPYTIAYLNECKRLPVIRESRGKGYPVVFHTDSIKVIRDHMSKQLDG